MSAFLNFADWTGLEPATSAVTGRHSNQLNYQSFQQLQSNALPFWDCKDSNKKINCANLFLKKIKPYLYTLFNLF